jgi:hypothetical protein
MTKKPSDPKSAVSMRFLPFNSRAAYSTDFRSCTFSRGGFFKSLSEEILEAFLKAFPSFLDVSYIM